MQKNPDPSQHPPFQQALQALAEAQLKRERELRRMDSRITLNGVLTLLGALTICLVPLFTRGSFPLGWVLLWLFAGAGISVWLVNHKENHEKHSREALQGFVYQINLTEVFSQWVQEQTLTTLDERFEMKKYQFVCEQVSSFVGMFSLSTYWLTPGQKLVKVDCRWWQGDPEVQVLASVQSEADQRRLLREHEAEYRQVFGDPMLVQ